jgi:hypothetical protein
MIAGAYSFQRKGFVVRIRVIQRPSVASIDGLELSRFEPGYLYDVGTALGCLMLAEGWAQPVVNEGPALLVPLDDTDAASTGTESNLKREVFPPYADDIGIAADFKIRKRRR